MKIHWVDKFAETDLSQTFTELEKLGVEFDTNANLVICGSINKQNEALKELLRGKKVINYCWDYYKWAREGKSLYYDWKGYEDLLRKSLEVWVPSSAQQLRLSEWGIDSKVIHTAIQCETFETRNDGFVLDHVRHYPEENGRWAEMAGEKLGIKVDHSEHRYTYREFVDKVASCSFLVCALREASTGGLPLVHALWNGKPSLVSDSLYQGGRDYLGDFATTFKHDDFNDLERKMKEMFENPPVIDIKKAREFISSNFTHKEMAGKIYSRLCELSKK